MCFLPSLVFHLHLLPFFSQSSFFITLYFMVFLLCLVFPSLFSSIHSFALVLFTFSLSLYLCPFFHPLSFSSAFSFSMCSFPPHSQSFLHCYFLLCVPPPPSCAPFFALPPSPCSPGALNTVQARVISVCVASPPREREHLEG